jgi:hypothetical protein
MLTIGVDLAAEAANTAKVDGLGPAGDALRSAAPWLSFGAYEMQCRRSDHVTRPGPQDLTVARTEGWIAVPTTGIEALAA